jgi:hypothetical protein
MNTRLHREAHTKLAVNVAGNQTSFLNERQLARKHGITPLRQTSGSPRLAVEDGSHCLRLLQTTFCLLK